MRKLGIGIMVLLAMVMFFGCDSSKETVYLRPANQNTAPQVAAIPDQAAVMNMAFSVDLTPYVSDAEDVIGALSFYIVSGGGVLFINIESDMHLCTLSNNSAGRYGGAVAADWLDLISYDIILWSNTAATSGNEVYVPAGPVNLNYAVVPSAAQDPDRFFGPGITEDANCVNADPMFVTGPLGNYYLDPTSPAVDAGSDTAVNRGVDDKTTRTDGTLDSGTADIGYHYPVP